MIDITYDSQGNPDSGGVGGSIYDLYQLVSEIRGQVQNLATESTASAARDFLASACSVAGGQSGSSPLYSGGNSNVVDGIFNELSSFNLTFESFAVELLDEVKKMYISVEAIRDRVDQNFINRSSQQSGQPIPPSNPPNPTNPTSQSKSWRDKLLDGISGIGKGIKDLLLVDFLTGGKWVQHFNQHLTQQRSIQNRLGLRDSEYKKFDDTVFATTRALHDSIGRKGVFNTAESREVQIRMIDAGYRNTQDILRDFSTNLALHKLLKEQGGIPQQTIEMFKHMSVSISPQSVGRVAATLAHLTQKHGVSAAELTKVFTSDVVNSLLAQMPSGANMERIYKEILATAAVLKDNNYDAVALMSNISKLASTPLSRISDYSGFAAMGIDVLKMRRHSQLGEVAEASAMQLEGYHRLHDRFGDNPDVMMEIMQNNGWGNANQNIINAVLAASAQGRKITAEELTAAVKESVDSSKSTDELLQVFKVGYFEKAWNIATEHPFFQKGLEFFNNMGLDAKDILIVGKGIQLALSGIGKLLGLGGKAGGAGAGAGAAGTFAGLVKNAKAPGILSALINGITGYFSADEFEASKPASVIGNIMAVGGGNGGLEGALKAAINGAILGALAGGLPGALIGASLAAPLGYVGGKGFAQSIDSVFGTSPEKNDTAVPFGSHRHGLFSVPNDDYLALLHKDETVLPKHQASKLKFKTGADSLSDIDAALNNMPAIGGDDNILADSTNPSDPFTVIDPKAFIYRADIDQYTGERRADYRKFVDAVHEDPKLLERIREMYAWGPGPSKRDASSDSQDPTAKDLFSEMRGYAENTDDGSKGIIDRITGAFKRGYNRGKEMYGNAWQSLTNSNTPGHPFSDWYISSPFGPRELNGKKFHHGLDFVYGPKVHGVRQGMAGKPIPAVEDGVAKFSKSSTVDGVVELQAYSGRNFRMAHLDDDKYELSGEKGRPVKRGEPIATVKMVDYNKQFSNGPHLHFEYRLSAKEAPVDPKKYLNRYAVYSSGASNDSVSIDKDWLQGLRQTTAPRPPRESGGPDPSSYSAPIVSQLSKMTSRLESKLEEVNGMLPTYRPSSKTPTSVLQYA